MYSILNSAVFSCHLVTDEDFRPGKIMLDND